jgi:glucan biosynthesis protein
MGMGDADVKLSENRVVSTRIGLDTHFEDCRQIVIDFKGPKLDAIPENNPPQAIANCSTNAAIVNNQVMRNPYLGNVARDFENAAQARQQRSGGPALHAAKGTNILSETWTYQWSPP